ncbi:CAAD domain-containing protein [Tumidithrix helvetica PCC 7403]|uniref:CAAD domain-containing protein n=1 Tax=Tumidithrix helvetica TaxID=3457545 RepID=UPI003CAB779D
MTDSQEKVPTTEVISDIKPDIAVPAIQLESSTGEVTTVAPTPSTSQQMVSNLLEQLTKLWSTYFGENQKISLNVVITALLAIPLLILASATLNFINSIPLLPSILEIVGFGALIWFTYRYLLLAQTRQELMDNIGAWKQKIFG